MNENLHELLVSNTLSQQQACDSFQIILDLHMVLRKHQSVLYYFKSNCRLEGQGVLCDRIYYCIYPYIDAVIRLYQRLTTMVLHMSYALCTRNLTFIPSKPFHISPEDTIFTLLFIIGMQQIFQRETNSSTEQEMLQCRIGLFSICCEDTIHSKYVFPSETNPIFTSCYISNRLLPEIISQLQMVFGYTSPIMLYMRRLYTMLNTLTTSVPKDDISTYVLELKDNILDGVNIDTFTTTNQIFDHINKLYRQC